MIGVGKVQLHPSSHTGIILLKMDGEGVECAAMTRGILKVAPIATHISTAVDTPTAIAHKRDGVHLVVGVQHIINGGRLAEDESSIVGIFLFQTRNSERQQCCATCHMNNSQ